MRTDPPTPAHGVSGADHRCKGNTATTPCSAASLKHQHLRADPRFRHLVDQLHRLGPRPVGELLIELAVGHSIGSDVLARLERMAELDPATVARLDACDWPPLPLHRVAA